MSLLGILGLSGVATVALAIGEYNEVAGIASFFIIIAIFLGAVKFYVSYTPPLSKKEEKYWKRSNEYHTGKRLTPDYNEFCEAIINADMKRRGYDEYRIYESEIDVDRVLAKAYYYSDPVTREKFGYEFDIIDYFGGKEKLLSSDDYRSNN